MEEKPKNLKNTRTIAGITIVICIVSITFLDSCQLKKDNTILHNTTTFLKFPTYQEFCKIGEPEITNVVAFIVEVNNLSDSSLVITGKPFFNRDLFKSNFYLLHNNRLVELTFIEGESIFKPNEINDFFELSLDLANKFQPDWIDKIEYNSLRDSIYTIAREGILLYVPNEEDFEEYNQRRRVENEYSQGKYRFLKKPILISRDSTEFVYRSYLPPEGIDASEL